MAATGIAAAVTAERIARLWSVSPGFFKKPFGYSVIQQRPGALPKTSRTVRNAFIPFEDAIDGDAVFVPGSALGMIIVQLGHETVESPSCTIIIPRADPGTNTASPSIASSNGMNNC